MEKEEFNKIRLRKSYILRFLYDNSEQAYTQYEIAGRLGYQQKKIEIDEDLQWLVSNDLIYAQFIAGDGYTYFMITEKGAQLIKEEEKKKI